MLETCYWNIFWSQNCVSQPGNQMQRAVAAQTLCAARIIDFSLLYLRPVSRGQQPWLCLLEERRGCNLHLLWSQLCDSVKCVHVCKCVMSTSVCDSVNVGPIKGSQHVETDGVLPVRCQRRPLRLQSKPNNEAGPLKLRLQAMRSGTRGPRPQSFYYSNGWKWRVMSLLMSSLSATDSLYGFCLQFSLLQLVLRAVLYEVKKASVQIKVWWLQDPCHQ